MPGFRSLVSTVSLCLAATGPLGAQGSPMFGQSGRASADSAMQAPSRPSVRARYDSRTDSMRLSVVTHEGDFVFTDASPRLVWSVTYPGRVVAPPGPETVVLEMRTQSPRSRRTGYS